jgi:hypothetical protein
MSKETAIGSSQGGLVYLKYTYRYKDQFDKPNDDWLKCVEATSDELLGVYTRAEDDALTLAFGGRGKKRLNRVFEVIDFVYLDYIYPSRKQGKKRKTAASTISVVPKGKKIKVLTHRPRYIETATVPKLGEGTSSTAEARQIELPKVPIDEPTEAKEEAAKKPGLEITIVLPEILSPPAEAELPKVAKAPAITPKRRRMASVLDAVVETTRALTPAPTRKVAEAAVACAETEAEPSASTEAGPIVTERAKQKYPGTGMALEKENAPEKARSPTPKAPSEDSNFIIRHASRKKLSEEEIMEAKHYARELKYPKGALVYNVTDEDDFLYCLPDNKEISVCREMAKNLGFLKLEADLSTMSKDDLADSLAYNSLKVQK